MKHLHLDAMDLPCLTEIGVKKIARARLPALETFFLNVRGGSFKECILHSSAVRWPENIHSFVTRGLPNDWSWSKDAEEPRKGQGEERGEKAKNEAEATF